MIVLMNRRVAFGITFFAVLFIGAALHTIILGNNNFTWPEFTLLLILCIGTAIGVSRRFLSISKQL